MNVCQLVRLSWCGSTCPLTGLTAVCPRCFRSTTASIATTLIKLFDHIFFTELLYIVFKIESTQIWLSESCQSDDVMRAKLHQQSGNPPPPEVSHNRREDFDATVSRGSFHVPFCFRNYDKSPTPNGSVTHIGESPASHYQMTYREEGE